MDENFEEVVSTQKSLQSNHDPGWNDPPKWALNSAIQTSPAATASKRVLNKRVAFPLHSNSERSNSNFNHLPKVNLPPSNIMADLTTAPPKSMITPSKINIVDCTSTVKVIKEEALKETLDNLDFVTKQLDSTKANEIQKRLDRMETMWNEDKLNDVVQKILLEISKALKEKDVQVADQLHVSLMMNNASICSSWIPGIRQLITEIKNKKT